MHLQRRGAYRFDKIERVPVTTSVPIKRHSGEVGVHSSPRKRIEKVHRLGVHLVEVDSICSEKRYQVHTLCREGGSTHVRA